MYSGLGITHRCMSIFDDRQVILWKAIDVDVHVLFLKMILTAIFSALVKKQIYEKEIGYFVTFFLIFS